MASEEIAAVLIPEKLDPNLDETKAAADLGMKPGTLRSWRSRGLGPPYTKIGGRVRYDPADLEIYKGARHVQPRRASSAEHRA